MAHFTREFTDFFSGLSRHNSKEWFDANRKTYENFVKKPFVELVRTMIDRISQHDAEVQIEPKDAIFRINRDIRFSKDKTPYQTHVSANIASGGRKSYAPGFYFQLSHQKLMVGGGAYHMEKALLHKVRSEILYNAKEFGNLTQEKNFVNHFGGIQGEKNKILPAEFKEAVSDIPLLANKQFYYMTDLQASKITQNNLAEVLIEYYQAGHKLNQFLKRAMQG